MKKHKLDEKYQGLYDETGDDMEFIGIEHEASYSPTTTKMRENWAFLKNNSLVEEGLEPTPKLITIKFMEYFKERYSDLLGEFCLDGSGVEIALPPCTLKVHRQNGSRYMQYLEELKNFGFTAGLQAGIHLNVDYAVLGDSKINTIIRLLWFLVKNEDFMVKMSHRKESATVLADFSTFVGDTYNLSSKEERIEEFIEHKRLIEQYFLSSDRRATHHSIFNINFSKKGRSCMEIRWFGSTLDINTFYCILEFGYALVRFCRTTTDNLQLDLEHFTKYVTANASTYRALHESLAISPETRKYATIS